MTGDTEPRDAMSVRFEQVHGRPMNEVDGFVDDAFGVTAVEADRSPDPEGLVFLDDGERDLWRATVVAAFDDPEGCTTMADRVVLAYRKRQPAPAFDLDDGPDSVRKAIVEAGLPETMSSADAIRDLAGDLERRTGQLARTSARFIRYKARIVKVVDSLVTAAERPPPLGPAYDPASERRMLLARVIEALRDATEDRAPEAP